MAVSRRLRFEILRRDGHACRYCGAKAPDATLTVDHVIPVALGGGDEPNNLVTACTDCNSGKSSMPGDAPIVEDVDATAMLFARALEQAAAIRASQIAVIEERIEQFDEAWRSWTYGDPPQHVARDNDWERSVETFIAQGLDLSDLERFIRSAMRGQAPNDKKWKSFCAKCWTEIGIRVELARNLLEDEAF